MVQAGSCEINTLCPTHAKPYDDMITGLTGLKVNTVVEINTQYSTL